MVVRVVATVEFDTQGTNMSWPEVQAESLRATDRTLRG
ncbi:hypothetical protein ThimaDRAFT_1605 [Thiocapsa marina 5811]|uniref:Uncharacterized protein n=1 Tax=Thiocapsa marina 5811 TaxID=768671 RepID=F9U9K3_9GAMM|nr:hypothetical protein ThimaDRAFT_1605 [Thiocapsa marina 5811]